MDIGDNLATLLVILAVLAYFTINNWLNNKSDED